MSYVADLHIHSPYARSTSNRLTFDNLALWARTKGIDVLATGDFTHPEWLQDIRSGLREAGNGLLQRNGVFFLLGTEVACVSRQGGRSRRVHLLVLAPDLGTVECLNKVLATKGRLESDGRPILHVSPRDLVCTLLDINERCLVIPAHLWTPWFGLYGSKSGFDSLEECFGDVARNIHAVETGLSSDPAMNWRVPSLDRVAIVSFSDAHSLPSLGRESTVFSGVPSYAGFAEALKNQGIEYTVEFYPEEGKYHYSGHRRCGIRYSPLDVAEKGAACPVCGGCLTLGVMERVDELAAREVKTRVDGGLVRADNGRPPYRRLVPLRQVISESLGYGVGTKKVQATYQHLTSHFGSELAVMIEAPLSDIASVCGERVAGGIERVRTGDVLVEPGYDGVYGTVRVWAGSP